RIARVVVVVVHEVQHHRLPGEGAHAVRDLGPGSGVRTDVEYRCQYGATSVLDLHPFPIVGDGVRAVRLVPECQGPSGRRHGDGLLYRTVAVVRRTRPELRRVRTGVTARDDRRRERPAERPCTEVPGFEATVHDDVRAG